MFKRNRPKRIGPGRYACLVLALSWGLAGGVHAQAGLGGGLAAGWINSIGRNGTVSEAESRPALGLTGLWAPGDLLIRPAFLSDGRNYALSLAAGARFFKMVGLSARVSFLNDGFENVFLDENNVSRAIDRRQWFVVLGGELSFFPAFSREDASRSWFFSAGLDYLNGGTFIAQAGVGYVWGAGRKTVDK